MHSVGFIDCTYSRPRKLFTQNSTLSPSNLQPSIRNNTRANCSTIIMNFLSLPKVGHKDEQPTKIFKFYQNKQTNRFHYSSFIYEFFSLTPTSHSSSQFATDVVNDFVLEININAPNIIFVGTAHMIKKKAPRDLTRFHGRYLMSTNLLLFFFLKPLGDKIASYETHIEIIFSFKNEKKIIEFNRTIS